MMLEGGGIPERRSPRSRGMILSEARICSARKQWLHIYRKNHLASPPTTFAGGSLGLLSHVTNGNVSNHVFAVEIDTFQNLVYNDPSNSHVGVDINSLDSTHTYDFCTLCYASYFCKSRKIWSLD
jgi:hypothetical protein